MMRIRRLAVSALIALANSLAATSCAPRSNTGYLTSPVPPPTTTQNAQPTTAQSTRASQPADVVLRPTAKWLWVLKLQQDYLAKEGAAHRGPIFETLTYVLGSLLTPVLDFRPSAMREEPAEPLSEREVLAVLGPPDYGRSNQAGCDSAYRFRRKGLDTDLVVTITIDARGRVERFDWDALSSLRPEFLRLYRRTAGPATRPLRQMQPGDGYIGVLADRVSWIEGRHEYLGLGGVQVREVVPGSPADRAGLRAGDTIEGVDQEGTTFETFAAQITRHRPGQTVTLTVLPAGKTSWHDRKRITVTLGSRPGATSRPDGGG
jgi:hypothetical protein